MIPAYYEFYNNTKIVSGKNALENIPFELKNLGAKRPVVLTRKNWLAPFVTAAFADAGIEAGCVFGEISGAVTADSVNDIALRYRENGCDSIVAAGDGTAINTAQMLLLMLSQAETDIAKLSGSEIITRTNRVPFIAVPGSGEIGPKASLDGGGANAGLEFLSHNLLPDVTVIDIRATQKLEPRAAASAGMRTLARAIEAYTCRGKNPLSDAYAIAAAELVRDNLLKAVEKPYHEEARLAMLNASLLAGVSLSSSMAGLACAIGNACASVCQISRNEAVSVLLPHCMEFNLDVCGDGYARLLPWFGGEIMYASIPPQRRAEGVIAQVKAFAQKLNEACVLPLSLGTCGVTEDQLQQIAGAAVNDSAILMNPKEVSVRDILKILKRAI